MRNGSIVAVVLEDQESDCIRLKNYIRRYAQEYSADIETVVFQNGQDLIDAGMKPGKNIGYILESALLAVLEEPSLNDHDLLMMYALQMM